MHELAPLIYDLAIMLGLAAIVVILFQRIRQPIVLGYLVVGMILGPYTPPYSLITQTADIQILSELGVIFLMFSLGLEFSFHKLMRVGFPAVVTGVLEVIFMLAIGYATGAALGWSFYDSLFLGAALSISSTTIIIKAIDELKLKTKRFAELIFGILIVEDLLAILLLVGLSTLVMSENVLIADIAIAAFKLVFVVGGWFIVGYFAVPMLFRQIAKYISQETLTIVSVALCLFLVTIAAKFHYSAALGAFIMGSILAETVLIHRIETLIRPIRDIFAAVFFISVGMLINPGVIIEHWALVLIISLVTIFGKLIATSFGSLLTGQSVSTSTRVGFSMAQVGEFSFIIAGLGVALGVTGNLLYPIIVAVSVVTTFTTPYLIRFSGYISYHLEKKLPNNIKYFLTNYSAWVYRVQTSSQQQPWFRKVSIRLLANSIVVAIVFTVVYRIDLPDTISVCLAILLSSPFIWGMLFSYRAISMPEYGKGKFNPIVSLVWLLTLIEIAFLSIVYFQTWIIVTVFAVIMVLFFAFAYKHLEKSYQWFEQQLISNISQKEDAHTRYEELAPWDTHLVEIEVGEHSPYSGKTLGECQVRQNFGVNVVAIAHGADVIVSPRGTERILAHDKLIVLGNDKQIEAFKPQLESVDEMLEPAHFLDNFTLKAILIGSHHALNGKTIRDSFIREAINGMVVGLERSNVRLLNPDPDIELKVGDLLLVVGEVDKLTKL